MSDNQRFSDVTIEDPGEIHYYDGDRDVDAVARLDLLIIREAWNRGMDVEDLADGFAVASEIDPETGEERTVAGGLGTKGDWSGIRDSSEGGRRRCWSGPSTSCLADEVSSVSYVIECRRSGDGYMEQATAPAKDKDGNVMIFEEREEAGQQVREWRENTTSPDVSYRVRERNSVL